MPFKIVIFLPPSDKRSQRHLVMLDVFLVETYDDFEYLIICVEEIIQYKIYLKVGRTK